MVATKSNIQHKKTRLKVPDYLVYELIDGKPIFYKGYREVMSGEKTFSEIMGSSGLQSLIVTFLVISIGKKIDDNLFTLLTSEAGLHIDRRNSLAGDIVIFDNETLPITAIDRHYVDVPPKIVVEVDITADPTDIIPESYIFLKTQKLLSFGVEKVIWVTTDSKKVTIAASGGDNWIIQDWHKDVEIMDGITVNIGQYLTQKGSPYA